MKLIGLSGLVALLLLTSCSQKAVPPSTIGPNHQNPNHDETLINSKMSGGWRSVAPEKNNIGQYATREYHFTPTRWEMIYTLAQDADLKKIIFIFRTEGPYIIEGPSLKVPAAFNTQFRFSKKYINVRTKDKKLAKVFKFDECRLQVNTEVDVTDRGCSFIPKLSDCQQEFDLVKIDGSSLFLGEKPQDNNLCTADRRPETLALPLKRIN